MLAIFRNGNSVEATNVSRIFTDGSYVYVQLKTGDKILVFQARNEGEAQDFAAGASAAVNRALSSKC